MIIPVDILVVIVIGFFLLAMVVGVPVYAAMGISALLGNYFLNGSDGLLENAALLSFNSLNSFVLLAVPLYILAGTLLQQTGLATRLFTFAALLVSGVRGGLGVATVVACTIFAAISGSSVATAATIGLVAIPALRANGYGDGQSGSLIAAGGTLGILIPPSIPLLIYGVLTDQSVGALFMAGVIPGLFLAALIAGYCVFRNPRDKDVAKADFQKIMKAGSEAWPILFLPVLIFIAIYTGIATPTEVAALAVGYTLLVGLIGRRLNFRTVVSSGLQATHASVMIFLLVAFGALMTNFLAATGVPQKLVAFVAASDLGFFGVVTLMILFYLVLGMFLESLSMMLISVPILYPLATSLGIHPYAFAIFVVLAVEMAQITPPVGINLFTISKVGNIPFERMIREVVPFVLLIIVMMYAACYLPDLSVWLPKTMNYK